MRRFVLVGVAVVVIAGIGGAIAWGTSGPDVDLLTVRGTAVAPAPMSDTTDASVVWSGDEFIVWGGGSGNKVDGQVHASGAAYDPATDSWRTLAPAPIEARERHTAVWTGTEMVVWGGTRRHFGVGDLLDGARYDPTTDTWRPMSPAPAGTDRSGGQAVVVNGRVIIGAGFGPTSHEERTVLVHDLSTDRWDTVPVADPVIHLLPVGDEVALLTAKHAMEDDEASELRVELLDPATGAVDTVGHLDLATYPDAAGLLEHDGDLTLVVDPPDGDTRLYRVDPEGPVGHLTADRAVDLPAPVSLLGGPEPQPVLRDGSRRMLVELTHGPVHGVDLSTGDMARGGFLEGAAMCLANGQHGVADDRLFVWAASACTAGPGGPEGPALVEVGWEPGASSVPP